MRADVHNLDLRVLPGAIELDASPKVARTHLPGEAASLPLSSSVTTVRGVRLDAPLVQGMEVVNLQALLDKVADPERILQPALTQVPGAMALVFRQLSGQVSDAELDIRLTELLGRLGHRQTELNIQQLRQATEQNRQQMALNAQKMEEVAQRQQDAGTASVFGKVFGWAAALVSIVVGSVMVATGLGAVVGGLMIASGVAGAVSLSLNQAAQDGHISKEVAQHLGPLLMAVEVALAVASVVLTCGASLATVAARVAGKFSGQAAQAVVSVGQKLQGIAAAGASSTASAGTQAQIRMALNSASIATNALSGAGQTASSVMQGLALSSEAQLVQMRVVQEQGQAYLDRLAEDLQQLLARKQLRFEQLLNMLSVRDKACSDIASRTVIV